MVIKIQNKHAVLKYFAFSRQMCTQLYRVLDFKNGVSISDVPELDEQPGSEAPSELSLLGPLRWDNHIPG